MSFNPIGHLNALQATGKTQAAANAQPVDTVDIPISKPNIKLSSGTLEALTDPQPGSFISGLNKLSGLIDFKA